MISCQHIERLLFDFVEGDLDPEQQRKLQDHLADCSECVEFVETYRQTIALAHDHDLADAVQMPLRLREKLEQFIRQDAAFRP